MLRLALCHGATDELQGLLKLSLVSCGVQMVQVFTTKERIYPDNFSRLTVIAYAVGR
jgi:hypothetical protein